MDIFSIMSSTKSHIMINGYKIRTVFDNNNIAYYHGKDVCKALEYKFKSYALKYHVESSYKKLWYFEQVTYIREEGVYSLILHSTSRVAKEFKAYIRNIICPFIRHEYEINSPVKTKLFKMELNTLFQKK